MFEKFTWRCICFELRAHRTAQCVVIWPLQAGAECIHVALLGDHSRKTTASDVCSFKPAYFNSFLTSYLLLWGFRVPEEKADTVWCGFLPGQSCVFFKLCPLNKPNSNKGGGLFLWWSWAFLKVLTTDLLWNAWRLNAKPFCDWTYTQLLCSLCADFHLSTRMFASTLHEITAPQQLTPYSGRTNTGGIH